MDLLAYYWEGNWNSWGNCWNFFALLLSNFCFGLRNSFKQVLLDCQRVLEQRLFSIGERAFKTRVHALKKHLKVVFIDHLLEMLLVEVRDCRDTDVDVNQQVVYHLGV